MKMKIGGDSRMHAPFQSLIQRSTVLVLRMAHRKWKETKQEPGTAGPGNMLGCCLVSLHFLCYILCSRSVGLTRRGFLKSKYYWGYKSKYCIGWEGGRIMVRLLLCATAICKHTGRHRKDRWDSIQSTCFLLSVI